MTFAILLAAILGTAVPAAHADPDTDLLRGVGIEFNGSGLPPDLGQVSVDAARRAVRARMTDWDDDRQVAVQKRRWHCGLAGEFSPFRMSPIEGKQTGPAAPLYVPFDHLAREVSLTSEEQVSAESLMRRELQDKTDWIRQSIEKQWFRARVAGRLYDERFEANASQATGWAGMIRGDFVLCIAYHYRVERDQELLRLGRGVLRLYDILERELNDAG